MIPGGLDFSEIMRRVYLWLAAGLAVTFGVAYIINQTIPTLLSNPVVTIVALVAYLILGFGFYPLLQRVSLGVGALLYLAFTAVFGVMISSIFLVYSLGTIWSAFLATATMFAALSIIGYFTKIDLSRFGSILFMALIGIILASIVNFFVASSALYWILTYAIVVVFAGLTAYDTQWIRKNAASVARSGTADVGGRIALIGGFRLFLDFINLFLALLRIFGGNRG
ncbi:MAG TPA: Bax inhibitor-1/YccA family protein [Ktedonobacterales bacterium]|nr:Bax inhibitor-1/YccA family protein [Ktedonobacterales bacterium]